MQKESVKVTGTIIAELFDKDGKLKARCVTHNLQTAVGDQVLAGRAYLVSGAPAAVTGMKLGTGSTAPAKTGAGAALATYLTDSHQAFNSNPTVAAGVATFVATWAPGKATTTSPITEVVMVNEALANATSAAANTTHRGLLTDIPAKTADDTLTVTWIHNVVGQ